MTDVEQRRVVPVSMVMTVCFSIMAVLQVAVIAGGLELKSATVQKVAPWAYEPFLRLVGEHPDQLRYVVKEGEGGSTSTSSGINTIAGFSPDELEINLENTTAMPSTNVLLEPSIPTVEPEPEEKPDPDSDIPVG